MNITSSQMAASLRSLSSPWLMIVNSPDRLAFTERLPIHGSMDAPIPTMFEMVAVGAIAAKSELRMPLRAIFARSASQSSCDE